MMNTKRSFRLMLVLTSACTLGNFRVGAQDKLPPPPTPGTLPIVFSATRVKQIRQQASAIAQLPEDTPEGWSKSRVDPTKMLTAFSKLKVRQGYVLRAYVFRENGNSNGFVWALPADAPFPEPNDCPRVESHFLKPPKPFDALDDIMEAIDGDGSPESYLQASILRRELREFGGGWHGIKWGMNTVLDASPWEGARPAADDGPMTERPTSKPAEWKWLAPKPMTWKPEVRMEQNKVVVTFYSYTPIAEDAGNEEPVKERIIRHTDTYRRGKYRPLVEEKKIAVGPNMVVF